MNARPISKSEDRSIPYHAEEAVSRFAFTYLVVAILIFLAMGGYLPTSGAKGSSLASTVSASNTLQGQLFQAGMWGIACVLMLSHWKAILRSCSEMKAIMSLSLLAPVSALWSQDPGNSLRRGGFLVLGTLFAFYLVQRFSVKQLAQVLVITGVLAGALGVVASIAFPQIGVDAFNGGAWQGIFRSKNGCAQVMLFLTTPAIMITFSSRYMNLMRYLLIALTSVFLVMSNAKTAWILAPGYLCLMAVFSWMRKLSRRDALFLLIAGGVSLGVAVISCLYLLPFILNLLGKEGTISGRLPLWGSAILSGLKRPILGYGYASFWTGMMGESLNIFTATGFEIHQAQNGLLEIWLELGAVGVLLMTVTLISALRDALTCFQHGHTNVVNWYIGLIVLTICYNIDETFLATAHSIPWLLYIVACSGLAIEAKKLRTAFNLGNSLIHSSIRQHRRRATDSAVVISREVQERGPSCQRYFIS
jgi:exopolysaccharide production protein ExoQ